MKPFIVIGDKTSHGGVVIGGATTSHTADRSMARVGDKVTCPKKGCPSITVIATSSDPTIIVDGMPVALHGDKTACGASLISSQVATNSNPIRSEDSRVRALSTSIIADAAAFFSEQASHDIHFLIQDESTGTPLANIPYKITLQNGKAVTGISDTNGLTEKISDVSSSIATLEAPYYGDGTNSTNSGIEHSTCGC